MLNNIMIVDDSATARMITKRCLEIAGFGDSSIIEAVNGEEALKLAKAKPVDIFLVDMNMPVMDGQTLLRKIKTSPKLTSIPVLIISSLSSVEMKKKLIELGAEAVISKPISPQLLLDALSNLKEEDIWGM
ncbi:MAG: response regulator [Calditrichaeota bacterium]|nr:response regulator [Calditrichota bacterium]